MPTTIQAYAAEQASGAFTPFEYQLGELQPGEVDLKVDSCGICHSDLSMLNNDWGMTAYPFVGGHEVAGTVEAVGEGVNHITVGQKVGVGWFSHSCMTCNQCMSGNHNLCGTAEGIIVGRHGGFADRVRVHSEWLTPIPDGLDFTKAGPLFCGGITVFNPIVQCNVKPTDRVGVIGIGGLGHLALQFLSKWGCEVTAFTSSDSKAQEAKQLGATKIVNSRSDEELDKVKGYYDFIISTVNVALNWPVYIETLAPKGRLHVVGAAPDITVPVFPMLVGQRTLGASPLGSPATTRQMIDFCARHDIAPVTEHYPMSQINDAMEHLHAGKARYRIVLEAGK